MSTQVMTEKIAEYFKTQPVLKAWLFGSFARSKSSNHLTGCAVDIRVTGFEQAIRYASILLDTVLRQNERVI